MAKHSIIDFENLMNQGVPIFKGEVPDSYYMGQIQHNYETLHRVTSKINYSINQMMNYVAGGLSSLQNRDYLRQGSFDCLVSADYYKELLPEYLGLKDEDDDSDDDFIDKLKRKLERLLGPLGGDQFPYDPDDPYDGAPNKTYDPLVLDLDGDGIETSDLKQGTYFDFDQSGFAEKSAWVRSDDGLLVMDRNNDGKINNGGELFGDRTQLKNGSMAKDGFEALADLDSNNDGVIDINDEDFTKLQVWRDLNGDGQVGDNELFYLNQLEIKSLKLSNETLSQKEQNGNILEKLGSYEKEDGTSLSMGEYFFRVDTVDSKVNEEIQLSDDIKQLPNLKGHGNIYDLWAAMQLDSDNSLKSLVELFKNEVNLDKKEELMDQILYEWTNVNQISPSSRGGNMDARQLEFLEKMFGQNYIGLKTTTGSTPNPNPSAAVVLKEKYQEVKSYYYTQLLMQTNCKEWFSQIKFTWDVEEKSFKSDLSQLQSVIKNNLDQDYTVGLSNLKAFVFVLTELNMINGLTGFDSFYTDLASYNEEVAKVITSLGKSIIDGNDSNNSLYGNDKNNALYGGVGDDSLYGQCGNDVLYGEEGDDSLYGGNGNDILDGGIGNDYLEGGAGNDTYIWGRGYGNDRINNYVSDTNQGEDTIKFRAGITKDDLLYLQSGNNIILELKETGEKLTVVDWFKSDTYKIEYFMFDDGTEYTAKEISKLVKVIGNDSKNTLYGTEKHDDKMYGQAGDDNLYGNAGNDVLYGGIGDDSLCGEVGDDTLFGEAGDDSLYGGAGDELLDGGEGTDYLDGGYGNDTYIWGKGYGNDRISNYVSGEESHGEDTVKFGERITKDGLEYLQNQNDLIFKLKETGETLTIVNWFTSDKYKVEHFVFADGSEYTTEEITDLVKVMGTDSKNTLYGSENHADQMYGRVGDDTLYGRAGDDLIYGGLGDDILYGEAGDDILAGDEGDDSLYGGAGNDLIAGGIGNDYLNGGTGNDFYLWGKGSGNDRISNYVSGENHGEDTVKFGEGITKADLEYLQNGNDVIFKLKETGETLTIVGWFNSEQYKIEHFIFADESEYSAEEISGKVKIAGTVNIDYLYGSNNHDNQMYGNENNDYLYGANGNDTLDGGAGNDYLEGGYGDDTYIWGKGYGNDRISNYVSGENHGEDTVKFGEEITKDDLEYLQNENDVIFKLKETGETLTISNWFTSDKYKIEHFVFADGSEYTTEEITNLVKVMGTDSKNTLYGADNHDDKMYGNAGNDTVYGRAGNDLIHGGLGDDSLYGENGDDSLYGDEGDDSLYGGNGNDILDGGAGNDYLEGGYGDDTYIWGKGYGNDRISNYVNGEESHGEDTVNFGEGITKDDLEYLQNGNDVIFKLKETGETLTITSWFNSDKYKVEKFIFVDGSEYTTEEITDLVKVVGTDSSDSLYGADNHDDKMCGNAGNDYLYGRNGNDVIYGGIGADYLYGESGNDDLYGEEGNDYLYGGAGNDLLDGGEGSDYLDGGYGNDTYIWGKGSGNDRISNYVNGEESHGEDTVNFGEGITKDDLEYLQNGNDVIFKLKETGETLTITGWFNTDKYKVEHFVFAEGSEYVTAEINNLVKIVGNDRNDSLYGVDNHDDQMYGKEGNDYLYGRAGNDAIYGGLGNDRLYGEAGDDVLYGEEGDDILYGSVGNDILDGGAGNDYLEGGCGNDTYIWGKGYGDDQIYNYVSDEESHGEDTVKFGVGITKDDLEYLQSGNNVILKLKETSETLTIVNWFISDKYKVEYFVFADGSEYTLGEVENLVKVVGTDGSDNLYGASGDHADKIYGGAGNDNLYGREGNDKLYGEFGDDKLYGGIGDDILDGGLGNDYLEGGPGNDTYIWGRDSGNARINNYEDGKGYSEDTVKFGYGITKDDLEYWQNENDIIFKIKLTGKQLEITDWFKDDAYKVEHFVFADGSEYASEDINKLVTVVGVEKIYGMRGQECGYYFDHEIYGASYHDDIIYGTDGSDALYGKGGNDSLYGGAEQDDLHGGNGNDILYGESGDDFLWGDSGNDILDGGAGDDYLNGGNGDDSYLWGKGSGNDVIDWRADDENSTNNDTIQFGEGIAFNTLSYFKEGLHLVLKNKKTNERLTLLEWFGESQQTTTMKFDFMDGSIYTAEDITKQAKNIGLIGNVLNDIRGQNAAYTVTGYERPFGESVDASGNVVVTDWSKNSPGKAV